MTWNDVFQVLVLIGGFAFIVLLFIIIMNKFTDL